jgi:GTP-binding protein
MQYLGKNGIPFSIIFTKSDKLKPNAITRNIEAYRKILLETWEDMPNYFITSSTKGTGQEAVLEFIDKTNEEIQELKQKNL